VRAVVLSYDVEVVCESRGVLVVRRSLVEVSIEHVVEYVEGVVALARLEEADDLRLLRLPIAQLRPAGHALVEQQLPVAGDLCEGIHEPVADGDAGQVDADGRVDEVLRVDVVGDGRHVPGRRGHRTASVRRRQRQGGEAECVRMRRTCQRRTRP
jgi:hypothetical protein